MGIRSTLFSFCISQAHTKNNEELDVIVVDNDGVGAVSNGRGWRPIAPQSGRRRRPAESDTGPGADMSLAFPRAAKKDSVAKTESTGPRVVSEKIGRVDRDQVNG